MPRRAGENTHNIAFVELSPGDDLRPEHDPLDFTLDGGWNRPETRGPIRAA